MQLGDLPHSVIFLVIAGIAAAVGAYTTNSVQNQMTAGSLASAAAGNATSSIGQLASWLPTIAIVLAASVIIGVVVGAFVLGKR